MLKSRRSKRLMAKPKEVEGMPERNERNGKGNGNGRAQKPRPRRLGFFLRRKAVSAERRLSVEVADVQLLERRLAGEGDEAKRNALKKMLGLRREMAVSAIRSEMPALEEIAARLKSLNSGEATSLAEKLEAILKFGKS